METVITFSILLIIFAGLFYVKRSLYFNIYFLGYILLNFAFFILGHTFFRQFDNQSITDFLLAFFVFAVVPVVLLLLSVVSFFSSKILMEKEGRSVRHLFISLIGVGSISILGLTIYLYVSNDTSLKFEVFYFYIFGIFFYFMLLYTATAIYAWLCTIIPPKYKVDYIIVLGSGLIGDKVPPLLASRLNKAVKVFKKHKEQPLFIVSGGQGSDEDLSEAEAMKAYILKNSDLQSAQITMEDQSTTTYENMLFSKRIIDGLTTNATGVFVTNNFHVYRGNVYANQVGLKAEGIASKTALYYLPNAFTREFIGLLEMKKWYHITFLVLYTVFCFFIYRSYT